MAEVERIEVEEARRHVAARQAEASAAGQAAKYRAPGMANTRALKGGVEAWKNAGYPMAA